MDTLFSEYVGVVIFFHVLSAIIWVGGMIALRVAVHPSMHHIEDVKIRVARMLEIMGRFFNLVMPFIVIVLVTGLIMLFGFNFKAVGGHLYITTHIKEAIWLVMALNYSFMYKRRIDAQRAFVSGDVSGSIQKLSIIQSYLIPINIFLGLLALYLGVVLRGF